MKILVTGGAGFIGSNFIRYVLKTRKDCEVVNYDKLTYAGNLANLEEVADRPNYTFIKSDICDNSAVEAAMRGCDAVVHFAAESHVDRSIYAPAPVIETNIKGTFTLLEVARALRIGRFLHVSTDEVYGDMPPGEFADENSAVAAEQPLFGFQGGFGSSGALIRAHVRPLRVDHSLLEQLRALSVPGEVPPPDDHERARS